MKKNKILVILIIIILSICTLLLGLYFINRGLIIEKWESVKTIAYLDEIKQYEENKNFDNYEFTFYKNKVFINNKTFNIKGFVDYKKENNKIFFHDPKNKAIFQGEYALFENKDEVTLIFNSDYGLINYVFKKTYKKK